MPRVGPVVLDVLSLSFVLLYAETPKKHRVRQNEAGDTSLGGRVGRRTSRSETRVGRRHESVGDTPRRPRFPLPLPSHPTLVRSTSVKRAAIRELRGGGGRHVARWPSFTSGSPRSKSDDGRSKSVEPSFLRQSHSKLSTWPRLLPSANVSTSLTHHTGGTRRGRRGRRVCVCVGS